MIRTRNFKVRNERLRKGKVSAVTGKQENAINGRQRDSVQKEMLAVSAMTTISMERIHSGPLLLPDLGHKK